MEEKVCIKCQEKKSLQDFNKCSRSKDGHHYYCKACEKAYYVENRDKILAKQAEYNSERKDKKAQYDKEYRVKNKDKIRERNQKFYLENTETIKKRLQTESYKEWKIVYDREYYLKTKEDGSRNAYVRKYYHSKREEDPTFGLDSKLRCRINSAIQNQRGKKAYKTIELLGCSVAQCRQYLESQFTEDMSWSNHSRKGWHIDHIRPCSSFDLTDPEQQKECFHYTNLQPLWAEDNLKKSDKLDWIKGE